MSAILREILEAVALALVVFILIQVSLQNFRVEGSSMSPALEGRQYLLVNKLIYQRFDLERFSRTIPFWKLPESRPSHLFRPPTYGEIIVFHFPNEPRRDFVKRVIGLPGDEVEIVDGKIRRNGYGLVEPYLRRGGSGDMAPRVLAEDEYFVLGDNRQQSNDSRNWGPVPEENIVGKVWVVYWPFSAFGVPR